MSLFEGCHLSQVVELVRKGNWTGNKTKKKCVSDDPQNTQTITTRGNNPSAMMSSREMTTKRIGRP